MLSNSVKGELNEHLKHLVKPLAKHQNQKYLIWRLIFYRNLKEKIFEALRTVDEHGVINIDLIFYLGRWCL